MNAIRLILFLFFSILLESHLYAQTLQMDKVNEKGNVIFNTILVGEVSQKISEPLRIKVTQNGVPQKNISVYFQLIESPENQSHFYPSKQLIQTNDSGFANFNYIIGNSSGNYYVSASIVNQSNKEIKPILFKIKANEPNWMWWLAFGIIGGLALFLTGVNVLSEGLQKTMGIGFSKMMTRFTDKKHKSIGSGIFLSVITQSSSAVSAMMISFVDSGVMSFKNTLGVIIGAALGTTITIQLVSFNISNYSLIFVGLGFILEFLWKNHKIKNIGHTLLGIGLLFLGLGIMSQSIEPLKFYQPFLHAIQYLKNPYLGLLIGCLFTAITQSSSMFIGIIIIMGGQGLLSISIAIPILFGANLGTSVTALIAAIGRSKEAKKVAWAHTLYRVFGVLFIIGWLQPYTNLVQYFSPQLHADNLSYVVPRQIANAHTYFYLMYTLISIPFIPLLIKLTNKMVPGRDEPEYAAMECRYLDNSLIETPHVALSLARNETSRMIHLIQDMTNDILIPFLTKENQVLSQIKKLEKLVDFLQHEIQNYVIKIVRSNSNSEIVNDSFLIIAVSKECEQIADIITTNLLPRAEKWVADSAQFSNEGKRELILFHSESQQILFEVLKAFEINDKTSAKKARKNYKNISSRAMEFEKSHYQRLKEQNPESLTSSGYHIEIIGMLNAISRHAYNMARFIEG